MPRLHQREIRRQIHALGGHLRRIQIKFTLHRRIGAFDDDKTVRRLHAERQPVRVRPKVQRLAGLIRDMHRHRQSLAGQKLILIQRQTDSDLRRRIKNWQQRQTENKPEKFHLNADNLNLPTPVATLNGGNARWCRLNVECFPLVAQAPRLSLSAPSPKASSNSVFDVEC